MCSKKTSGDATGSVRGRTYSPRAEPGPAARPVGGWDGPNFAENDVFFDFVGYDREKSIFSFF